MKHYRYLVRVGCYTRVIIAVFHEHDFIVLPVPDAEFHSAGLTQRSIFSATTEARRRRGRRCERESSQDEIRITVLGKDR